MLVKEAAQLIRLEHPTPSNAYESMLRSILFLALSKKTVTVDNVCIPQIYYITIS
jgi:hypothetical protein